MLIFELLIEEDWLTIMRVIIRQSFLLNDSKIYATICKMVENFLFS